jgi:hypothetical protein
VGKYVSEDCMQRFSNSTRNAFTSAG